MLRVYAWGTLQGPVMKAGVDAIHLSPHLDDVVLSCGGQIAARCGRGESVLVVTLAAGDAKVIIEDSLVLQNGVRDVLGAAEAAVRVKRH